MKRSGSGWVSPSSVTRRSCIASSSAACVLGGVRLISSASSSSQKIGPRVRVNWLVWKLNRLEPRISPGSRSGVNWMRPKSRPSAGGEALREEGLGGARRAFQQHVALREISATSSMIDHPVLPDDRLGDFGADGIGEAAHVTQAHGHCSRIPVTACGQIVERLRGAENVGGFVGGFEPRGAAREGFFVRQAAGERGVDRSCVVPRQAEPVGEPARRKRGIGRAQQAQPPRAQDQPGPVGDQPLLAERDRRAVSAAAGPNRRNARQPTTSSASSRHRVAARKGGGRPASAGFPTRRSR